MVMKCVFKLLTGQQLLLDKLMHNIHDNGPKTLNITAHHFKVISAVPATYSSTHGFLLKHYNKYSWSQWLRGLRRRSTATRPLRLWDQIPPGAWMCVYCECYVVR